ncbi:MAG: hypothetical protein IT198_14815 [Acidimicrobiia bacterium]|nr:hypothetical protein [Acidimicrobiia bacterium]
MSWQPVYQPLGVGEALRRGWAAFQTRLKDYLVVAIAFGLAAGILLAVFVLGWLALGVTSDPDANGLAPLVVAGLVAFGLVSYLVMMAASVFVQVLDTRIALAAVDGELQYGLADLARQARTRFWPFLGWTLLAGLVTAAVSCIPLGGVVASFFLLFVPFIVLDHGRLPGVNPLTGSFEAVKDQAGNLILVYLALLGIAIPVVGVTFVTMLFPPLGIVVLLTVGMLYGAFVSTTIAVVYRASPLGGGVGGFGMPGTAIPPYDPYAAPPSGYAPNPDVYPQPPAPDRDVPGT